MRETKPPRTVVLSQLRLLRSDMQRALAMQLIQHLGSGLQIPGQGSFLGPLTHSRGVVTPGLGFTSASAAWLELMLQQEDAYQAQEFFREDAPKLDP